MNAAERVRASVKGRIVARSGIVGEVGMGDVADAEVDPEAVAVHSHDLTDNETPHIRPEERD